MAVDLQKLKRKMRGVTSTRQVTRALQMVSAMKMRKAQERSARSRDYRKALHDMMETFRAASLELSPELAAPHSADSILLVIYASDRGLCGPFNNNVINLVQQFVWESEQKVDLIAVGWKVGSTLLRRGYRILSNHRRPAVHDRLIFLKNHAQELWDLWNSGRYSSIQLVYSSLRGMTVERPASTVWLPFQKEEEDHHSHRVSTDYIDERNTASVYAATVRRYLDNSLLAALLESEASEHVARMVAMDNATRNAEDLFDALQLTFNKARQAKITQEICEIVAGANAIGKG